MNLFTMYRTEPMAEPATAAGGIGGKVTVEVIFIPNSLNLLLDEPVDRNFSYKGKFTGVLLGILTSEDRSQGRMFFEGGIEVIYNPELVLFQDISDTP